ncbi:GNAT family N-acetyltransferase [Alkaliphilus hydrothermalis]|uniref:GNAT superfamily N-acetyltransferase n=1 Tax=Alkaliphilus hydrothermalis TaxID=1482730 RepID=A0ABS2NLG8_9FIRM|nr:GNAT family N-acetyltransferase [Alkaliphilus hydrothermalis]MBM7613774.1 GNAT superfamily N-acetyltransferase [Alkaliphilus hydrothermalis]
MIIRKLSNKEIEMAVELNIQCWNKDYAGVVPPDVFNKEETLENILIWINDETDDIRRMYGAFHGDQFVGYIGASIAEEEDSSKGVEINYLFVNEAYRGKGISIKLMKTVVEEFIGYGFMECIVYNWYDVPSNKFYRYLGGTVKKQMLQSLKGQKALVDIFVWDLDELLKRLNEVK